MEFIDFDVQREPLAELEEVIANDFRFDFRLIFEKYQLIAKLADADSKGSSNTVVLARYSSNKHLNFFSPASEAKVGFQFGCVEVCCLAQREKCVER